MQKEVVQACGATASTAECSTRSHLSISQNADAARVCTANGRDVRQGISLQCGRAQQDSDRPCAPVCKTGMLRVLHGPYLMIGAETLDRLLQSTHLYECTRRMGFVERHERAS